MTTAPQIDLTDLAPFIAGTEHEAFRILRQDDPLHWNDEPSGGPGFWSITRYADLITAVDDPVTYINGEGTQILSRKVEGHTSTVHNTDAPRHMQLRRLATPHLRAVKIRDWMDIIDSNVDEILDEIEDKKNIEFVHNASALLPIRVLGEVLGVPHEDGHLMLDWTNRVVSDDPEYMTSPDEKERARNEMFAYFKELTEARRKNPRHDIISILVQAKIDDEPLSWEDLAAYYFVLVGAGNETTRNLLTGSMLAFGENPGQWDRLRADRDLLGSGIEELLRYITPIRAMRRTATTDVEWYGKTIKQGDKVVLWFQAANRDPDVFDDPDSLKVDRFPNEHVGFGWGVHSCMGSHLARAEVNSFLGKMLERDMRVVPLAEPDRLHTNQFHAFKRLRVDVERA